MTSRLRKCAMTDDYWGPPEDDLERLRAHNLELELGLDEADQEADRLLALLRRWVELHCQGTPLWGISLDCGDADEGNAFELCRCYECSREAPSRWDRIPHAPGCIVGDTLGVLDDKS